MQEETKDQDDTARSARAGWMTRVDPAYGVFCLCLWVWRAWLVGAEFGSLNVAVYRSFLLASG